MNLFELNFRTENSKISEENAENTDCGNARVTAAFSTGAVLTPTYTVSSPSKLPPLNETTTSRSKSKSSKTSQLRRGDVTNDAGLVQVTLIISTLIVTLVLSAVIIAVIVRIACNRHRGTDHYVISGLKAPEHVVGSRVSVRHCPPEDVVAAEGWRSRASSLGRGGRAADCQRPTGGKEPVCDDVSGRLVVKRVAEVEPKPLNKRLFANGGGGARLTDEQWRMYTWEDT